MRDAEKIRKVLDATIPLLDTIKKVWPMSEIVRITLHTNNAVINGRDRGISEGSGRKEKYR